MTLLVATQLGCQDKGKISEREAVTQLATLVDTVNRDVREIEDGLPAAAKKGVKVFYGNGNPRDDLGAVRRGLAQVQRQVPELTAAKSTFFALLDEKGVAVRNNLETDAMGGRDIFQLFPALAEAKSPAKSSAKTVGVFPESKAAGTVDPTWLAASAIREGETLHGFLLTGWSFRRFAYHLQESLRTEEKTKLLDRADAKLPILYVAVFDEAGVYTAPQTPQVNEEALQKLDLPNRAATGVATGVLDLEGRPFGWAAIRTPNWGDKLGVVLLRSEV